MFFEVCARECVFGDSLSRHFFADKGDGMFSWINKMIGRIEEVFDDDFFRVWPFDDL